MFGPLPVPNRRRDVRLLRAIREQHENNNEDEIGFAGRTKPVLVSLSLSPQVPQ